MRTIDYKLEVLASGDLNEAADQLMKDCPAGYNTSGVNAATGTAYIRFRAENDSHATDVAWETTLSTQDPWVLSTGYGTHRRIVKDTY